MSKSKVAWQQCSDVIIVHVISADAHTNRRGNSKVILGPAGRARSARLAGKNFLRTTMNRRSGSMGIPNSPTEIMAKTNHVPNLLAIQYNHSILIHSTIPLLHTSVEFTSKRRYWQLWNMKCVHVKTRHRTDSSVANETTSSASGSGH